MPRLTEAEINTEVAQYHNKIKFPKMSPAAEIADILEKICSHKHLRSLGTIELSEYSVLLASYSLFLTKEEAELNSIVQWCESHIKHIVGRNIQEVQGYFNEKDHYIRSHDTNAMALDEKKSVAEAKLNSIRYISQKINYLSEVLNNLSREKNNMRKIHI